MQPRQWLSQIAGRVEKVCEADAYHPADVVDIGGSSRRGQGAAVVPQEADRGAAKPNCALVDTLVWYPPLGVVPAGSAVDGVVTAPSPWVEPTGGGC